MEGVRITADAKTDIQKNIVSNMGDRLASITYLHYVIEPIVQRFRRAATFTLLQLVIYLLVQSKYQHTAIDDAYKIVTVLQFLVTTKSVIKISRKYTSPIQWLEVGRMIKNRVWFFSATGFIILTVSQWVPWVYTLLVPWGAMMLLIMRDQLPLLVQIGKYVINWPVVFALLWYLFTVCISGYLFSITEL